jgi:hypothetical protein
MKCPVLVLTFLLTTIVAFAQTESARISGRVTDLSGAVIVGAECKITNSETNVSTATTTNQDGIYVIPDLRPAMYRLTIQKEGFRTVVRPNLQLYVQDAVNENFTLALGPMSESVTVFGAPSMLQTESAALGRVVNQTAVSNLPLVTRNFTQIAGLSPGVTTGVNNAGELGLGGGGLSQIDQSNDGIFVHGARSYDNNFQIDGLSVSDVQGTEAASGGVPIPNPDAIREFKVQTALYDASYGRYAGANISMITRTGGNAYH